MAPTRFDRIVVGAGQAGVPLAARLAGAGRSVLLVERKELGGTCVNTGCTPTKTLYASARAAHVARTAGRLGVRAGAVAVDFAAVMRRKDEVVARWRESVARRLAGAGDRLRVVRGHARFVGARTLEAAGETFTGDAVVLDLGVRPAPPPVPGLETVPWLDNRRALELERLPGHLLVLGGGYIGCELGQMFRRFGARVTVVQRAPHLLDREDPEVSEAVEGAFRAEGIDVVTDARVASVAGGPGEVRLLLAGGRALTGSHLLVAVGRRPNTEDLGAEAGGVALDARGYVQVDDAWRTSAPGVYAAGDVTGGPQFTHTAWDDGRLIFELLEGRPARPRSGRVVPSCVFTDPQVGRVGLNEREARAAAVPFEAAAMPFGQIARAIESDEPAGIVKVLVDPGSERILGASIVGAEAGELVHVFAALMQAGASARAMVDGEYAHPTFCEGLQSAVMRLPRFALR